MLLGSAAGLWLIRGPVHLGNVVFDVQSLLYAAVAIIIGFQAITFALFTKIFAISEGLLPEDARLKKAFRYIRLESGLLTGSILILAGIGGSLYAVGEWGMNSFGPLAPHKTLRVIIPAITALVLGFQIVLSSFFLSVLGMKRR
jgi:hypothetical protein